jgi:hypothetical protein
MKNPSVSEISSWALNPQSQKSHERAVSSPFELSVALTSVVRVSVCNPVGGCMFMFIFIFWITAIVAPRSAPTPRLPRVERQNDAFWHTLVW